MSPFIDSYDVFVRVVRIVLTYAAVAVALICATDWAVRTRRISAFGAVARFMRKTVDPLMAPIERRVVRAGGMPASAPWWTLVTVVAGGLLLVALLDFFGAQLRGIAFASRGGASAVARLLLGWVFAILKLALLIRVLSSWIRISPYSKWIRWTFTLTEPLLRPLRQLIRPVGAIDFTPLVAFFVILILEGILL